MNVFEQRLLEAIIRRIEEAGGEAAILDGGIALKFYGEPFRLKLERG